MMMVNEAVSAAHNGLGIGLAVLIIAVILAYALFVLGAVVSAVRSPMTGGMKLVWIVLICVAPFLGSLLWFVIGRPNAYPAGTRA